MAGSVWIVIVNYCTADPSGPSTWCVSYRSTRRFLPYIASPARKLRYGVSRFMLATVPFVYGFNARLGLSDFRREVMVLVTLPVGWMCGYALNSLPGYL